MARVSLSWALILGLLAGIGPMCTDLYLPALPEMSEQLAANHDHNAINADCITDRSWRRTTVIWPSERQNRA